MLKIASSPKNFYSPLRYPGGKSCLSEFLTKLIKENELTDYIYVEPYAGGAGAALTLLILEKVESIIINDKDRAIYSFWNSMLNETERFIDRMNEVDVNISEWHYQKEVYRCCRSDDFDLGFATFYLNRANRSGILEGGVIGGVEQKGKWGIDARFNKTGLSRRIKKIASYRNRIQVRNEDGIDLFNTLKDNEKTLVYLDPPYYVKGSSLYLNHYTPDDHSRLAQALNSNPNSRWLLSYDNVPQIRELYEDRQSYEFSLNYHADQAKKGKEVLVLSDALTMVDI